MIPMWPDVAPTDITLVEVAKNILKLTLFRQ